MKDAELTFFSSSAGDPLEFVADQHLIVIHRTTHQSLEEKP